MRIKTRNRHGRTKENKRLKKGKEQKRTENKIKKTEISQ